MHWYAIQIKPHQERFAAMSLSRLEVETFTPLLKRIRLVRGKRQEVTQPLFPGYLFARFDADTRYRAVNYAAGVRRVVAWGSSPVIVEDSLIVSIQSRLQNGCVVVQPPSFSPGQTVRILDGPLQGLSAVFERELNGEQRVVLLLQALSCTAHVVIDRGDVELADGSAQLIAA